MLIGAQGTDARVSSAASADLKTFLDLRKNEDRLRARAFFEAHPKLRQNASACAEEALNLALLKRNEGVPSLAKQAAALAQSDAAVLANAALALSIIGNKNASMKLANDAVVLEPTARNFATLAEVLHAAGRDLEVEKALVEAEKRDRSNADVACARSRIALTQLRQNDALKPLNAYLSKHPSAIAVLLLRAETHAKLGATEKSIADFSTILRAKPSHSEALRERGDVYRRSEKWKLSIIDLKKLRELDICDEDRLLANVSLAKSLDHGGDLQGALQARKAVVSIHTKTLPLAHALTDKAIGAALARDVVECVRLQNRLKQFELALKDIELVLRHYPMDSEALEQRALTLEGLGRLSDAVKAWTVLIEKHRHYPRWLRERARVFEKMGLQKLAKADNELAARYELE